MNSDMIKSTALRHAAELLAMDLLEDNKANDKDAARCRWVKVEGVACSVRVELIGDR